MFSRFVFCLSLECDNFINIKNDVKEICEELNKQSLDIEYYRNIKIKLENLTNKIIAKINKVPLPFESECAQLQYKQICKKDKKKERKKEQLLSANIENKTKITQISSKKSKRSGKQKNK